MRAVRFDRYGDVDVLDVVEVEAPAPGVGEALVAVRASGINPGEVMIREGALHERWPATFPSGQGSELSGPVVAVGRGVGAVSVGDEVLGFTDARASQAEQVSVPQDQLVRKPPGVSWEAAGGLKVAGTTAWASVEAVEIGEGDTVVVAGATGGVGSLTVQLARLRGATVIGLASEENRDWLTQHGVRPVDYRAPDALERIRAADGRIDAFLDTHGGGYVEMALSLGVDPQRVNTIIDFAAAEEHGTKSVGGADASTAKVLGELAELVADGRLEVPIAATYPLQEVRAAYRALESGHARGKIVLVT